MLSLNRYNLLALLLSLASVLPLSAYSQGRATVADFATTADSAWKAHDYAKAAKYYEEGLKRAHTDAEDGIQKKAALHYNLANCYYRLKDYPQAVLHYERCLRLAPSNEDAAFNLELTRTKLTDHYDEPAEMFFVSWFRDFVRSRNAAGWGALVLLALFVCVIPLALFVLGKRLWVRKLSLGGVVVMAFMACCFFAFAVKQQRAADSDRRAVVLRQVPVYDSPTRSARQLALLHEGTTVVLQDAYSKSWQQAELPDGRLVWIQSQPGAWALVKE